MLTILPDNPLIDVGRVLAIGTGVILFVVLAVLMLRPRPNRPQGERYLVGAQMAYSALCVIHEAGQLGHPFIVYILPLLLLGNCLAIPGIVHRVNGR